MSVDLREARIILQNALAHATKIVLHNSHGEKVDPEDVLVVAKKIAQEVVSLGIKKEK